MLSHPTLDILQTLRLHGRYYARVEQIQIPESTPLSVEER